MNLKQKIWKALEDDCCETCNGVGVVDDADAGDIYFNVYICDDCDGTGIKKEKQAIWHKVFSVIQGND